MNAPDAPENPDRPVHRAEVGQRSTQARRMAERATSRRERQARHGRASIVPWCLAPFFWTPFLGALNDSLFTVGVVSVVTFQARLFGVARPHDVALVAGLLFVLPFLVFSAAAAQIADKVDHGRVIRASKTLEIITMIAASAGFLIHDARILDVCILLLGVRATLFHAVKRAYVPTPIRAADAARGKRWLPSGTLAATLLGLLLGGVVASKVAGGMLLAVLCLSTALAGRVAAGAMPSAPALLPERPIDWNPLTAIWRNLRDAAGNRTGFIGLIGIAWLWCVSAFLSTAVFGFARDVLHAGPSVVTLMLAVLVLGGAAGVMTGARFADGGRGWRFVPSGGIGVTVFAVDLYLASRGLPGPPPSLEAGALYDLPSFLHNVVHWRILCDLLLLALTGGVCSVPLYRLAASRGGVRQRARSAAPNPTLTSASIVAALLLTVGLDALGVPLPILFLLIAGANTVVIGGLCATLPTLSTSVRGASRRVR
jgi:hypothetical protein